MNSLDLISLKKNVKDYLDTCGLPKEAIRLVLREIYEEVQKEAVNEALEQAKENHDILMPSTILFSIMLCCFWNNFRLQEMQSQGRYL